MMGLPPDMTNTDSNASRSIADKEPYGLSTLKTYLAVRFPPGERRNRALNTMFVSCFSLLSFFGTFVGMQEVLKGGDTAGWLQTPIVFILVVVATLAMVRMLYLVAERVTLGRFLLAVPPLAIYLFLVFFSVTFGFAFYWRLFEARQQAVSGAERQLSIFNNELKQASYQLNNALKQLEQLSRQFDEKKDTEIKEGGTCGDSSPKGRGPRVRHRERRSAEISSAVSIIRGGLSSVEERIEKVKSLIQRVQSAGRIEDQDESRQAVFTDAAEAGLDAVAALNALIDNPQTTQFGRGFELWAGEYQDPQLVRTDDPNGVSYKCVDLDAATKLRNAAAALTNLPRLSAPELPAYAGVEATREAVRRMIYTVGQLAPFNSSSPPQPTGISETYREAKDAEGAFRAAINRQPAKSTRGQTAPAGIQAGLTPQDRFPLAVAAIVDVMLFVFVFVDYTVDRFTRYQAALDAGAASRTRPLDIFLVLRSLVQDDRWKSVSPYLFDYLGEHYIAEPLEGQQTERTINHLIAVWRAGGLIREALAISNDKIRRQLTLAGSVINAGHSRFRAWRFSSGVYTAILLGEVSRQQADANTADREPDLGESADASSPQQQEPKDKEQVHLGARVNGFANGTGKAAAE